jgi:hypothetical protein
MVVSQSSVECAVHSQRTLYAFQLFKTLELESNWVARRLLRGPMSESGSVADGKLEKGMSSSRGG